MALIDLARDGDVFVLTMRSGENRFNRPFLDSFTGALDEVERSTGPAALVTVGGEEKFYSNGLDLGWLSSQGSDAAAGFVGALLALLGRLLAFPIPTVAAINGHAFAAGAMLALAHDFRVMRADRGYVCLPEVDLPLPLAPGMTALIASRLPEATLRHMVLTGARLGGTEACARGVVEEAVPAAEVLPKAIARAAALAAKDRTVYAALKRGLYAGPIAILAGEKADAR